MHKLQAEAHRVMPPEVHFWQVGGFEYTVQNEDELTRLAGLRAGQGASGRAAVTVSVS